MFADKEWGTLFNFWSEELPQAFQNYLLNQSEERTERFETTIGPVLPAAGLVMFISFVERLILDALEAERGESVAAVSLTNPAWQTELRLAPWNGYDVLCGLVSLRHCFAHEYGRVTERQQVNVENFLEQIELGNASVTNFAGKTIRIRPFYSIDSDNNIVLSEAGFSSIFPFLGGTLIQLLEDAGHLTL